MDQFPSGWIEHTPLFLLIDCQKEFVTDSIHSAKSSFPLTNNWRQKVLYSTLLILMTSILTATNPFSRLHYSLVRRKAWGCKTYGIFEQAIDPFGRPRVLQCNVQTNLSHHPQHIRGKWWTLFLYTANVCLQQELWPCNRPTWRIKLVVCVLLRRKQRRWADGFSRLRENTEQ